MNSFELSDDLFFVLGQGRAVFADSGQYLPLAKADGIGKIVA